MRCIDCKVSADGHATGWRASIIAGWPPFVIVYCPGCALLALGPRLGRRRAKPSHN